MANDKPKKTSIRMTEDELAEFKAFKAEKEKLAAQAAAREERADYKQLVDDTVSSSIKELVAVSEALKTVKQTTIENFKSIIETKKRLFNVEQGKELVVKSHTFTHSDGRSRVIIGNYQTDAFLDTVEEGIAMVREYIESLAKDESTSALVSMVMKLLSKDRNGSLKASSIISLRKIAEDTGDDRFIEGVKVIEEAYCPTVSKVYVRAEVRDDNDAWKNVPLQMTEV